MVSISYVSQFLWPTSIMLTLFSSTLDKKFGPLCLTSSIIHSPWLLLTLVHELGVREDFLQHTIVGISCLLYRWHFPIMITLFLKDTWSTVLFRGKDDGLFKQIVFFDPRHSPLNSYWLSTEFVMKQSQRVNSGL